MEDTFDFKEEKLSFFMHHIWFTMYDGFLDNHLDMEKLCSLTTAYIKCSFDAEKEQTSFKELPENDCGYYNEDFGPTLNSHYQDSSDLFNNLLSHENCFAYPEFIVTATHEFTHRNDTVSNKVNNLAHDSRFARGYGYIDCLSALGQIYGKKDYEKLGKALYYTSSNEVVARNVSYGFTQSFAQQLRKLTNEKLPKREDATSHFEQLTKLSDSGMGYEEASAKSNCSILDGVSYFMHHTIDKIEENVKQHQEYDNIRLFNDYYIIKSNLQEAQQDFFNQCNKYLSGKYTKEESDKFEPYYMAILLNKPEFFNKKIGDKLYKKILKDKDLSYESSIYALKELSSIEELNISEIERELHLNNYKEYKTFLASLDKKNLSK